MKLVSVLSNAITMLGFLSLEMAFSQEMGKIIFANVLFRHGDRTPVDPYPNDPYKNASFWPVGFGQLTNTGKMQEYALGQWLRKRYDHLLTDQYSNDVIYVQSTDVDRTLMSAASNLAAMFPPEGSQVWNPNIHWQPIPVHTIPEKLDKVLAAKYHCPAYEKEFKKMLQSKEIQELDRRFSDVYKILNENTGERITTMMDIEYVYNTLYIEKLYNFTLPDWSKDILPQMEEASKYSFAMETWTPKLARLKTGLLIQDMIKHMTHKIEKKLKPDRNVWLYSAHDTTVSNLLNTLGVFDIQNPPYSAAVLVELRVDSNGIHQVMLFYRNSTVNEPVLLTLPGCSPICPLDKFIELCKPKIPDDWDRECSLSLLSISSYSSLPAVGVLVSFLLLLILAVSVMTYYRLKNSRHTHCHGYSQFLTVPWDRYSNTDKFGPHFVPQVEKLRN